MEAVTRGESWVYRYQSSELDITIFLPKEFVPTMEGNGKMICISPADEHFPMLLSPKNQFQPCIIGGLDENGKYECYHCGSFCTEKTLELEHKAYVEACARANEMNIKANWDEISDLPMDMEVD
jgi:hypothetical protein